LGCYGHVVALRRAAVGPFHESHAVGLPKLQRQAEAGGQLPPLLPVEAGLAGLPILHVSSSDAGRLARGQGVLLRGRDAPILRGWISVLAQGTLLALAEVDKGEVRPRRIFNLRRT
jgi:tRNA pseudouridine55 synthase